MRTKKTKKLSLLLPALGVGVVATVALVALSGDESESEPGDELDADDHDVASTRTSPKVALPPGVPGEARSYLGHVIWIRSGVVGAYRASAYTREAWDASDDITSLEPEFTIGRPNAPAALLAVMAQLHYTPPTPVRTTPTTPTRTN